MGTLRLILIDQLSQTISSLVGVKKTDTIMFCEVIDELTIVKHHKKKITFLLSAMRHFSQELQATGYGVRYIALDDKENTGSLDGEIARAVADLKIDRLIMTEASEYRILGFMKSWQINLGIDVEIRNDDRFLSFASDFSTWAKGKKQLRMEFFYREMRKRFSILIDEDGKPTGGEWNYDKENRKPPKSGMVSPSRISHKKSEIVQDVLKLVAHRFPEHFGTLEPFHFAVTREQALIELNDFIERLLPNFGDYQDAMVAGEPYLYHSLISSYLNAGLLLPLEVCQMAGSAYRKGKAPLNAVEGFIRQILGWREYIRGMYWHFMPAYGDNNYLLATEPLPEFYWTAKTEMFCVAEAVRHTRDHAYSHHIQRLMITGNFALLAGLDVREVQEWYLAVYADAFEWVEMPNTLGMALFGDGGTIASKPYAASGKYIHRMSNYCQKCSYDPDIMIGERACPFNALYWDFMVRHQDKFRGNARMPYVYATWDKFTPQKQAAIRGQVESLLQKMREKNL
jgi:deoxyribodipyrimidine photolyase-related protein